jgi:hypothetical protein
MIDYGALIHDRKYFDQEHILERQARYGFTQAGKVEAFLWDLELFGQLQRTLGNQVVLKGGAAAQLFFAPERQRTSVDIDVIYLGDVALLPKALASIHDAFGKDDLYFKFSGHVPLSPKTKLPLETYFVSVPTSTGRTPINMKVDFHLMDGLDLQVVEIEGASAFVIPLAFRPRCLSAGSLIGDKLLTLAQGSVGIPPEREDDIPKQLYDLVGLSRVVESQDFEAIRHAMGRLFEHEQSVRSEKVSIERALEQMVDQLERYAGLDSHKSDKYARVAVQNFRGNYEPRPFRDPIAWGVVSKRLELLVKCIAARMENPVSYLRSADRLEAMIAFKEEKFKETRLKLQELLRKELLDVMRLQGRPEIAKRLKNTRVERLLWEVLTPSNVQEIEGIIASISRA